MENNNVRKACMLSRIFSCVFLILITGCAGQATSVNMIPDRYELETRHKNSVSLRISGGRETNPLWRSQLSGKEFIKALEKSIKKSKIFSNIIRGCCRLVTPT